MKAKTTRNMENVKARIHEAIQGWMASDPIKTYAMHEELAGEEGLVPGQYHVARTFVFDWDRLEKELLDVFQDVLLQIARDGATKKAKIKK